MSGVTSHNRRRVDAIEFSVQEGARFDVADLVSAIDQAEGAAESGLLEQLVRRLEARGEYAAALKYARRLWRLDPLHHETCQRLVHLYVLNGGRASALRALEARLVAATQGEGALVLIQGLSGIGKTSLGLACRERARSLGAVFAVAHCHERRTAPAYAPWLELLTQLQGVAGMDRDALPEPFGSAPPADTAYRLVQILSESLAQAAAERPLVLLLDDLHWADQDTLDLLEFVTRRVSSLALLLIATYRSEEIYRRRPLYGFLPTLQRNRPVETLSLVPLNPADTARLVEARHGSCSPELATYLYDRSEGNPLFLVALLDDLFARHLLAQDSSGRWLPPQIELAVPAAIQQLIAQRVDRLGSDVEALLEVAAVVGEVWDLAVVESVLGWPEDRLLRALERVLEARLILAAAHDREQYCFAHGLIREVLYLRPLARRRNQLHAQVGTVLEQRPLLDWNPGARHAELADHFYTAGAWEKAVRYTVAAGDAARERYASHSAAQFYEQALEAGRQLPEVAGPQLVCSLCERLGQAYRILNRKAEAEAAFSQMLEAARAGGDGLAEGRALSRLCVARYWLYRFDEARAAGEMALRLAEQAGDLRLLALTHRNLGHLLLRQGDLVRAYHHLERSEALARAEGEDDLLAPCLQNQSYIAFFRGDYDRSERLARQALALAERERDALTFCGCCFALGIARGDRGRYREARQALQAGIERAQASGERHYLPKLLNVMGWLHSELGGYKTAREWDRRALQACRDETAGRDVEAECYTLLNLATDALGEGDLATAERYAREFGPVSERAAYSRFRYLNRYQLLQAELALAYGNADAALQHARQAARMAEPKGALKNMAKSALYEGRALLALGHLEGGTASLQRAVALADQIGHGSLRWRARLRLGQAYAALGQPCAEVCRQALELVQEIAGDLQDERLRESLLNAPLVQELLATARRSESESGRRGAAVAGPESRPVHPAVADAPSPAGLTPREIQVLRLVAQGATNRVIAETLQISVKTVDAHVTHILNKTGCANRAAAAAFAAQHGLLSPQNR